MIRAFIAIEFAAATVNRISAAIEQLKPRIVGIRWVAPVNYHLTLKFLGNIDESQIETIGLALADALHPFQRFTINAKGLGVFPSVKRPRVLWVGLVGSPLTTMAVAVEAAHHVAPHSAASSAAGKHWLARDYLNLRVTVSCRLAGIAAFCLDSRRISARSKNPAPLGLFLGATLE